MSLPFVTCLWDGKPHTIHPSELLLELSDPLAAEEGLRRLAEHFEQFGIRVPALEELEEFDGATVPGAETPLVDYRVIDLAELIDEGQLAPEELLTEMLRFVSSDDAPDDDPFFLNRFFFLGAGAGGTMDEPCCGAVQQADTGQEAKAIRVNPWYAEPWYAEPFHRNSLGYWMWLALHPDERPPWATRAEEASGIDVPEAGADSDAIVWILDTALAEDLPPLLSAKLSDNPLPVKLDGPMTEQPDSYPADGYVDPVAGHSTFIAGIYEQLAPGCTIRVSKVVGKYGEVEEKRVADILRTILTDHADELDRTVVNLSFGSPDRPENLAIQPLLQALKDAGAAIVSSAGNDGSCARTYPAQYDSVFAVGALDWDRVPAEFSNYGSWVDVWTPGVDVWSTFHMHSPLQIPGLTPPGFFGLDDVPPDPDAFPNLVGVGIRASAAVDPKAPRDFKDGAATWSGTSFSAPVFGALIAGRISSDGPSAREVGESLLDTEANRTQDPRSDDDGCTINVLSESITDHLEAKLKEHGD